MLQLDEGSAQADVSINKSKKASQLVRGSETYAPRLSVPEAALHTESVLIKGTPPATRREFKGTTRVHLQLFLSRRGNPG